MAFQMLVVIAGVFVKRRKNKMFSKSKSNKNTFKLEGVNESNQFELMVMGDDIP